MDMPGAACQCRTGKTRRALGSNVSFISQFAQTGPDLSGILDHNASERGIDKNSSMNRKWTRRQADKGKGFAIQQKSEMTKPTQAMSQLKAIGSRVRCYLTITRTVNRKQPKYLLLNTPLPACSFSTIRTASNIPQLDIRSGRRESCRPYPS